MSWLTPHKQWWKIIDEIDKGHGGPSINEQVLLMVVCSAPNFSLLSDTNYNFSGK